MQKYQISDAVDWEDARLFLAVARAGQMLGASRALGVNQSTLSRRVAALEGVSGSKAREEAPTVGNVVVKGNDRPRPR